MAVAQPHGNAEMYLNRTAPVLIDPSEYTDYEAWFNGRTQGTQRGWNGRMFSGIGNVYMDDENRRLFARRAVQPVAWLQVPVL